MPNVLMILTAMLVLPGPAAAQAAVSPPASQTGKTGDLWEVASRMSMEGMEMPGPGRSRRLACHRASTS